MFDNELFLRLARKWPKPALEYLHKHFYHKLVHFSRQKTNDLQASEDIVSDVMLYVWSKSRQLADQKGFLVAPYLLMLVRLKSITFYRQSIVVQNPSPDSLDLMSSFLPAADEQLFVKDFNMHLRVLVDSLPRRERECIKLKYFDTLSNDAIATRLGVSKKTVEKRLTSGIRLLRKVFGTSR